MTVRRRGSRQSVFTESKTSATIVALATPPGQGSIAVIRISGPETFAILDQAFDGPRPSRQPSHTVRLGWMKDSAGKPIDQVMLTAFRAPKSYSGEHMAEVSCHGGTVAATLVLDRLTRLGCRPARPGEFTRRAVLAGKLSLERAEAVLDLVNAQSPAAYRAALARYQGRLAEFTTKVAEQLADILAELEHALNFEEETPHVEPRIRRVAAELDRELRIAERGRFLNSGARVAVVGRPNAGKSSLFNRLLGAGRAIESPVRGTTRDRVEATLVLGGVPVRLEDTAGISSRPVSRLARLAEGHARQAIAEADIVLAVFDRSAPLEPSDRAVIAATKGRPVITVLNKSDKPRRLVLPPASGVKSQASSVRLVSCRTGSGVARLRRALGERLAPAAGLAFASGERQLAALAACRVAVENSRAAPNLETAALEIRTAIDMLAQIDTLVPNEAVLDRIFARFCVGK